MIDIFNIQPNVVSRDLGGRSFLFYGGPKVGKTTIASHFEKSLIIAFEKGYGEIPGVIAQPVDTWAEFLQILNALKQDKKREEIAKKKGEKYECIYKTIIIDIADIAFNCCEKYILSQQGVDTIKDIPYGAGYGLLEKEFDSKLRSIVQMGYGLVLLSHAKITQSDENPEIKYATCTLPSTAKKICTRLVDVYAYASIDTDSEGNYVHMLHPQKSPYWEGGARLQLKDPIPLSYKALEDAVHEAIDNLETENDSNLFTDEKINLNKVSEMPTYDDLMVNINDLISKIMANEEQRAVNGTKISTIIAKYLGQDKKLSNATPQNVEQLILIEQELKDLI